ncbi:hypothetical protein PN497_25165 [Sphaerospermopsis kisseleviana CS-549]|uniref:Uncharacterized protein n=1 Tax=Sphaerospermopsis kisseleviana CS-549 TaxID=3021783 RepID=A0ABT4ZYV7_9CYAN|nr:hypothetical protein [Sphaerospermopsis kisseleviana]MDB9444616.1 hypothetical protein [Sphaerospermopsis kisseleviana CS-549]BAZ81431.1 acetolactate synthase [Sphaerospermopsis kisseleviana NIES-73]
MNYKAITLAAILGISTPAIIDVAMPQPALAQKFNYPKGHFADKDWEVSLSFDNNVYYYYGENRRNRNSNINLSGAVTSGTNDRQVYTGNNNGMKYRVTWRPSDPNFIRLEVVNPGGKVILNRILQAINYDDAISP